MKQRVKQSNERKKALFGIDDMLLIGIGSLLAAGIGAGASIHNANQQAKLTKELNEKQQRQATLAQNQENAINAQLNQQQALNYDKNNEIETMKTSSLKTLDAQQSQFKDGGETRKLRRKYKNYTDPYAKDWYLSIFRKNNFKPVGVSAFEQKQAALNAADYVESMYRYHQNKYLHNRDSVENTPTFVGAPSPKGYIPDTIKESLQFENYDSRNFGPYNNNYPNLPLDYNKYKCGGKRRMKRNGGTVTTNLNKLNLYI